MCLFIRSGKEKILSRLSLSYHLSKIFSIIEFNKIYLRFLYVMHKHLLSVYATFSKNS